MSTPHSSEDATVEKCLVVGHGFGEDDSDKLFEALARIDHRLHGMPVDRVRFDIMVKDREDNDQKVTLEGKVGGAPLIVATSHEPEVWAAVAEVREDFLRQYNDWAEKQRP